MENRQVLGDDADAFGAPELEIFCKGVGPIVQLLGGLENLLHFGVAGGAGLAVEHIGDRGRRDAGQPCNILDRGYDSHLCLYIENQAVSAFDL